MSMEKHKCKLCSRKFSSGKAMGGHMRSHLRTLPLPPKTPPRKQDSAGGRSESTLSILSLKPEEEEEEEEIREDKYLGYGLRENPKKSCKIVDPEFLDGAGSVVLHENESETESTKKPTRRRSKRTRRIFISEQATEVKKEKPAVFEPEPQPVSSFSDTSPEEDIAICLMMLSKDVWRSSYESDESKFRELKQGKFQCEICNKVLKSSQALGSHKTIHKKINSCIEDKNEGIKSKENSRQLRTKNVDEKVHECPFCGKIYGSGQALGGHKRSHLLSSSTTASSSSKVGDSLMDSTSAKFPNGFIDLNMPAPIEDEDFSQPEVSGVS